MYRILALAFIKLICGPTCAVCDFAVVVTSQAAPGRHCRGQGQTCVYCDPGEDRREGSVSQDRAAVGQGSGYKSRAGAAHQRGAGQCSRGPQIEVYRSGVSEKGEV